AAGGFEGDRMLRGLNKPCKLISDPRLIGCAFYLGSEDLDQQIVQKIQEKFD
ncbi:accessory Sec system protein Asp2, partial [Streptococcus suis]